MKLIDQHIVPPEIDHVTLCEINNELINLKGKDDQNISKYYRNQGIDFPHIIVPYEINNIKKTTNSCLIHNDEDECKRENIPYEQAKSLLKKGYDTLNTFIFNPLNSIFGQSERYLRKLQYENNLQPIKAFAWHRYQQVFAIAHRQDVVYLYDLYSETWFPQSPRGLFHEEQKDITCIEWRPMSSICLAVGTSTGVCLWKVPFENTNESTNFDTLGQNPFSSIKSDVLKVGSAMLQVLKYPGFNHISSLSWSPDGLLLAVGSAITNTIIVWDVAAKTPVSLSGAGGKGTTLLTWSNDGSFLCQSCNDSVLRIWETRTWTCRTIPLKNTCHTACWYPDNRTLIFSVQDSDEISGIQMLWSPPKLDYTILVQENLGMTEAETISGQKICIGGPIRKLCIDPTGQRLVVNFEERDNPGCELLGLFSILRKPYLRYQLIGFIRGPMWHPGTPKPQPPRSPYNDNETNDEGYVPMPRLMSFAYEFQRGALLSVCWENGKISFIPLLFNN